MHSYTQVGVGARKGFRMDTLSNLLATNGHLLRQIFYLKVTNYLAGCMSENNCTGGHRGGRAWYIATMAGKWTPAKGPPDWNRAAPGRYPPGKDEANKNSFI